MTKLAQKIEHLSEKDKASGVTRRGKLARTGAGMLLAMTGLYAAAESAEPLRHATGAAVNSVKEGAEGIGDIADGFSKPSEAEKLRTQYKHMREHPEDVEPGDYVTYMVDTGENPSTVARKLSGEGVDDTELVNILVAEEDGNHNLQPGPVIVPIELVQSDDPSIQSQIEPFPNIE